MAKDLKKPKYTWYGYNNGRYIAAFEGIRVDLYQKVTVVVVITENNLEATAWIVPYNHELSAILNKISELYQIGITFGEKKEVFTKAEGQWHTAKALHPLVASAMKKAWEWFKEVVKGGDLFSSFYEFKVTMPKGAIRTTASGVTFEGYTDRVLKAHSFATMSKLVDDATTLCASAWGWKARKLRVLLHGTSRALGLAYNPGQGVHRISLNTRLINEYDTMSIFRVVLHELCHHYRNETFPLSHNAHDALFCEALGKVDPIVLQDKKQCQFFTDEVWEGSTVVQAKMEKQSALKQADNYDPSKGGISVRVLADYKIKMDWLPFTKGDFKRVAMPLNKEMLHTIIGERSPSSIQVSGGNDRGTRLVQYLTSESISDAYELIKGLDKAYPSYKYGELL